MAENLDSYPGAKTLIWQNFYAENDACEIPLMLEKHPCL